MTKQLTILFLFAIFFASCSKDDETANGYAPNQSELVGKWYTTKIKLGDTFSVNIDSCNFNSYIQFGAQGQYAIDDQCTGYGFIGRFTIDNNIITCTENGGIVTYKVLHFKKNDATFHKTNFDGVESEFQVERK